MIQTAWDRGKLGWNSFSASERLKTVFCSLKDRLLKASPIRPSNDPSVNLISAFMVGEGDSTFGKCEVKRKEAIEWLNEIVNLSEQNLCAMFENLSLKSHARQIEDLKKDEAEVLRVLKNRLRELDAAAGVNLNAI